jgi:hypothetical protein
MNTDAVSLRPVTVEVVLRHLRMRGELPENRPPVRGRPRDIYLGTCRSRAC